MNQARRVANKFSALTPDEKLAIVRHVCANRGKFLIKKFDVCAIGAGYKKTGGEVLAEVCIGFLVDKKKAGIAKPVPPYITAYVHNGMNRTRYKIPTDVEELGNGVPHAMQNLANGISSSATANQALSLRGAACCIVVQKKQPTNRFLLGCHHVLALSLLNPQLKATDTYIRPRSSPNVVGRLYEYLTMSAFGKPCLDAAIALANPASEIFWNANGVMPRYVEPGTNRPLACAIFTPNGPRAAQFVKEWANVPLRYPGCGDVVIEAAYQFLADTAPGDSGSPVMEQNGTLHGMHFWGDETQRMAFAIPAFMLFRPGRFSIDFELVQ
ncbi:trypsin-like serine protease [Massilia sp. TWR1-2-2]|uniref:trypsin-like serine protease n=1 Tax=Massilia sp. TWR1-2-2 TaxID=2804584 RepID=UPI003CF27A4A